MEGELVLIGGPGDGEVLDGLYCAGQFYFRFRTNEERTRLGDALGDNYLLTEQGGDLIGIWQP